MRTRAQNAECLKIARITTVVCVCLTQRLAVANRSHRLRGSSEHEFQSKLQLTHIGSRRADPAERDARKRRIRFSPVRMVEEVERLEAEFQIPLPAEMKPLRHREVPVFDSGTDHFAA